MRKIITLVILLVFCNGIFALENPDGGARPKALSNAIVAVPDIWSTFHNQAGLAEFSSFSAAIYYTSKFNLKELSQVAGTVVFPTKTGTFGFCYSQFGTGQFKETKIGLAFSKKLGDRLYTGIQFDYLASVLPENSRSSGFVSFEGGILFKAKENLNLGAHIFNPFHQGYNFFSEKVKMPVILRIGAALNISTDFMICTELEKRSDSKTLIKIGAEFFPVENFAIRAGVSSEPFAYTAGIGYTFGKITTDITFHYHGNLGITPAISLQFNLK